MTGTGLQNIIMAVLLWIFILPANAAFPQQSKDSDLLIIRKTKDFEISGDGASPNWERTSWVNIPQRNSNDQGYQTRVKLLYSENGIYFLYSCADKKLTNTMNKDFLDLWNEDVIEVFLQPDSSVASYFEYELSPLNYELPISIFNEKGKLNSWIPFHYDGSRKTRHETAIAGGQGSPHSPVSGWKAEAFIPYKLMKPVLPCTPVSGTIWKGNLYRIDYDNGETLFSWQLTSGNFHEYEKFGSFLFE